MKTEILLRNERDLIRLNLGLITDNLVVGICIGIRDPLRL